MRIDWSDVPYIFVRIECPTCGRAGKHVRIRTLPAEEGDVCRLMVCRYCSEPFKCVHEGEAANESQSGMLNRGNRGNR